MAIYFPSSRNSFFSKRGQVQKRSCDYEFYLHGNSEMTYWKIITFSKKVCQKEAKNKKMERREAHLGQLILGP